MIRLNGVPSRALRSSHSWNVPWLSRPVRSSVRARISTAWKTSAFWSAIDTCAANSWTSSNSSAENVLPRPSRSMVSTPIAPPRPRSGTTIRLPSIGPMSSRKWLTRGSFRSSSTSTGSLCSRTHVATPVSPGSHGSR